MFTIEFNTTDKIRTVNDIEKFLEKIKDLYDPEKLKEIGTFPYLMPYSVPEELLDYGYYPDLFSIFQGRLYNRYSCYGDQFATVITSSYVDKYDRIGIIVGTIFINGEPATMLYNYYDNKNVLDKETLEIVFKDTYYFINNIKGIIIVKTGNDALERCKEIQACFDSLSNNISKEL